MEDCPPRSSLRREERGEWWLLKLRQTKEGGSRVNVSTKTKGGSVV